MGRRPIKSQICQIWDFIFIFSKYAGAEWVERMEAMDGYDQFHLLTGQLGHNRRKNLPWIFYIRRKELMFKL